MLHSFLNSVTSVGSTGLSGTTEVGAVFTSGGFSNVFSRPAYQAATVSTYLQSLGSVNQGRFNTSGRAYPDVSALGEGVIAVVGGETGEVSGTGVSSPAFASVIALLNDRLFAVGKPTLGFLNPFLYSNAAATLFDIVSGDNPGCNTNGFPAKVGWDPVRAN